MKNGKIQILIADDHEIVRRGVRYLLETNPQWEVCGEAANGDEALEMALQTEPDVVVLDVSMPPTDGVEVARRLRGAVPNTKVLIFSMHESEEVVRDLIAAGVRGYVLKSDADRFLMQAVETLVNGQTFFSSKVSETILSGFLNSQRPAEKLKGELSSTLTARETEITKLLASGKSNKEIAHALNISVKTVETHRRTIMHKLEIGSIVELVHYAIRHHLVKPAP